MQVKQAVPKPDDAADAAAVAICHAQSRSPARFRRKEIAFFTRRPTAK